MVIHILTLPLVPELVRCGEQVIYYSSPAFRQAVEQVGAIFHNSATPFLIIVIPQSADQNLVGQRIEQLGAGKALPRDDLTAHKLPSTAEVMLANPVYQNASIRLGKSFGTPDGYIRAADEIQAFKRLQVI